MSNNVNNNAVAIPCYRCGAPVAANVAALTAAMASGTVTATKAYYVHGSEEGGYTCGNVLTPGADRMATVSAPFRRAVKAAMVEALKQEGYVRILHVPTPVKAGSPEEGAARAHSASVQARLDGKGKSDGPAPTALAAGCMFHMAADGSWAMGKAPERVTAPAPVAPAPTVGAPPAPPAPPVATAPMAPPPPPPAPMAHVARMDGTVEHVTVTVARAMLADGRAYSVNVGAGWVASLP